ncbi:LacI family DNA-binding transcriptional regulator [Rubellicoccus peritrichatus]|uniref:LacI family DNA-binding transcriptional regulator n=1 Tax=Rubellicoccus peritrichatus TaxID=3080537 RepID=A0AAQ3LAI2_9BACT|nr:LacI family DNA-binding transcriptional regulator [Puniceicoccus sp. CR14]WOO42599.1 LacI family DNA-binding transcriptional regulator [Puniceicoccus sp. CR14]
MSRVTVRDVAKAVGCHYTTVAAALRNSTKVAEATKQKILAKADELGYRRDPYLSALNSYKRNKENPAFRATIGWIDNYPKRRGALYYPGFEEYFQGAFYRARELGYGLEQFWFGDPELRLERGISILRARNIQGVLLAPQPNPDTHYDFEWDKFSVVTFGYSIVKPHLNLISNHQFRLMLTLQRKLATLGYKRIGLHLLRSHDARLDYQLSGAYFAEDVDRQTKDKVPPLFEKVHEFEPFKAWVENHRPEVIITNTDHLPSWLARMNMKVPEDIGLALVTVTKKEPFFAGMYQNGISIGQSAVDLLDSMIRRGQVGIPEKPVHLLIDGEWQDGKSVRKIR